MSGKAVTEKLLESATTDAFEIIREQNKQRQMASAPGLHDLLIFDKSSAAMETAALSKLMSEAEAHIEPKRSKSIHRGFEEEKPTETEAAVEHITRTRAQDQQQQAEEVEQTEFELI